MIEEELNSMTDQEKEELHLKNCISCNPLLKPIQTKCACGCEN
jgi:hypothetical protein